MFAFCSGVCRVKPFLKVKTSVGCGNRAGSKGEESAQAQPLSPALPKLAQVWEGESPPEDSSNDESSWRQLLAVTQDQQLF